MEFLGKRLVVFGAGYVGTMVARQAVARGLRVTALTRNADKARALAAAGIETIVADLADDGWHAQIAGGVDLVLNSVSSGGGGIEGYRQSYVVGMRSVLAWAARGGLAHTRGDGGEGRVGGTLVYTSSTSVYPQSGGARVDEDAPVGGGSATADVLVEAENLLREAAGLDVGRVSSPRVFQQQGDDTASTFSSCGQRGFVLRLAGIYGPGRHHLHLLLPAAIVFAAILHAGLFFAFSIIYPHPRNAGPDPAQIFFVPPGTADAARRIADKALAEPD